GVQTCALPILQVVDQLADLHRGVVLGLVLAGHPHLGGVLDDLLPDLMDAPVELADGARPLGSGTGLVGELGEQRLEILHAPRVRVLARAVRRRPSAGRRDGTGRDGAAQSRRTVGSRWAVSTVTRAS